MLLLSYCGSTKPALANLTGVLVVEVWLLDLALVVVHVSEDSIVSMFKVLPLAKVQVPWLVVNIFSFSISWAVLRLPARLGLRLADL